jgi:hypothetical protein
MRDDRAAEMSMADAPKTDHSFEKQHFPQNQLYPEIIERGVFPSRPVQPTVAREKINLGSSSIDARESATAPKDIKSDSSIVRDRSYQPGQTHRPLAEASP